MFEAYFFDKRATINYRVYRVLKALQNTTFTVNRLSQEAQLSYSQAYNAFQDILADLQTMQDKDVSIADEDAYRQLSDDITVDEYRFHLLQASMAFSFFDYLFKSPAPDVHVFCAEHDVSISTLRRRIDPFKSYLQTKGVTLNTSSWGLEGSELRIRMVLINFFILGYRGAGWPLEAADHQAVLDECDRIYQRYPDQWFTQDLSLNKQDLLAMAVQRLRMRHGHMLPQEMGFSQLTQAPGMATLPPVIQAQDPRDAVNESGYYYFLRIHFLSLSQAMSATDKWLLAHFTHLGGNVQQFVDGLVKILCQTAPEDAAEADVTSHDHLRANLYRIAYSY